MVGYRIKMTSAGSVMTLSEETSRACGFHNAVDANVDRVSAAAALGEVAADAGIFVDLTQRPITVRATHPDCEPWVVFTATPDRRASVHARGPNVRRAVRGEPKGGARCNKSN